MEYSFRTYIISTVLAATSMFGLSYLWHGVILNDLERLTYPTLMFLILAAVVYTVIAMVMNWVFTQLDLSKNALLKGFGVGVIVGFIIYLIAFTLGVSFQANGIEHVVVDFGWQMFEEGVGGAFVALCLMLETRRKKFLEEA